MDLLIRNGRVVDPANGVDAAGDVLIQAGRVARVGPRLEAPEGTRTIDAGGRVVSVIELDIGPNGHGSDVVQTMHAVVNPDKLAHLGPVSDVARLPESRTPSGGQAAGGGA